MERVDKTVASTECMPKHKNKGPKIVKTLIGYCRLVLILLSIAVSVYIDRTYITHIDIDQITQCLSRAASPNTVDRPPVNTNEGLHSRVSGPRSTYEITTYDPFIDGIFNGSKTMVFIHANVRYDNRSICEDVEDMRGEIITLRSYKNQSLSVMHVPQIINNIRVKRVQYVSFINEVIGDISMNCGQCEEPGVSRRDSSVCTTPHARLFCKIIENNNIYSWFMPGVTSNTIIDAVASSYYGISHEWTRNYYPKHERKCSEYSVTSVNGYYFTFETTWLCDTSNRPSSGQTTSHINHKSIHPHTYVNLYRQCFIEIELVH